jgi:hypothetical protein
MQVDGQIIPLSVCRLTIRRSHPDLLSCDHRPDIENAVAAMVADDCDILMTLLKRGLIHADMMNALRIVASSQPSFNSVLKPKREASPLTKPDNVPFWQLTC